MALLYGNGDFQDTLDLACAIGFDADNQTATLCGLFGVINGTKGLPRELLFPVEGWEFPFNDLYKNVTRFDLPDGKLTGMAKMTAEMAGKIILANGGEKKGTTYIINRDARFNAPLEFTEEPFPVWNSNEYIRYTLPVSGVTGNEQWAITQGEIPEGLSLNKGILEGTVKKAGRYPVEITLLSPAGKISRSCMINIRPVNLAFSSNAIVTNTPVADEKVRNGMWYSFGKSLYANSAEVIRDGKVRGKNSVFYSIAGKGTEPKTDYFGYIWEEKQSLGNIGFHIGSIEENGGWFTSLDVEYLTDSGNWEKVRQLSVEPELSHPSDIYRQPHFIEYFISFNAVQTKGIRIIGEAARTDHWDENSRNVTPFISITELAVYSPY